MSKLNTEKTLAEYDYSRGNASKWPAIIQTCYVMTIRPKIRFRMMTSNSASLYSPQSMCMEICLP